MPLLPRLAALLPTLLLAACAAASMPGQHAAPPPAAALPAITSLDARFASDVLPQVPDVQSPLASSNAAPDGADLLLGPASAAWALYRIDPGSPLPQQVSISGSGPLWLLVADFSSGRWVSAGKLDSGRVSFNLDPASTYLSAQSYLYCAVLCEAGSSGRLSGLSYIPSAASWNISLSADENSISLSWNSEPDYGSFAIRRSTVPHDPLGYQVGVVSDNSAGNIFTETVTNYSDNTWEPQMSDNGTPGNLSDDFPSVAPAVEYYYFIQPLAGPDTFPRYAGHTSIAWGSRRSARRNLLSSGDATRVFADQLNVAAMTPQQLDFAARHFVGTQKIVKRRADELRAINSEFIVLGYHLGCGAGDIGNAAGNDWDDDADWPLVDAHENWFHHLPNSPEPGQRVDQLDYHWKVMLPDSGWQDYLSAECLQMLGEDHFDGWFIDSCSEMWNTSPSQWWPQGDSMFGFWTPRLETMLDTLNARMQSHPLQPYIFANAGAYITTISDIRYYQCDGIMVEGYGHNSPGSYFSLDDWKLEMNRILDHQNHGQAIIMQGYIDPADIQDRLFLFGSYLLVKGSHNYINWIGSGTDSGLPQWYPEWDVDTDISGGYPLTLEELYVQNSVYRRTYNKITVIVNPADNAQSWAPDGPYDYFTPVGGGNVDVNGLPTGSASWTYFGPDALDLPPHSALILRAHVGG